MQSLIKVIGFPATALTSILGTMLDMWWPSGGAFEKAAQKRGTIDLSIHFLRPPNLNDEAIYMDFENRWQKMATVGVRPATTSKVKKLPASANGYFLMNASLIPVMLEPPSPR